MPGASSPIVVNTGPIVALDACGQLDLLRRLHRPVVVPATVIDELVRGQPERPGQAVGEEPPPWLEVEAPSPPAPALLAEYLDPGEAEVIAVALDRSIPLVALDERRGRVVARTLGLAVTGSLGVLLRAKREGLLEEVRPCLEDMREHGIWLGEALYGRVLREAGE